MAADNKKLEKLAGVTSGKEDSQAIKEGWLTKQGNYIKNLRVCWFQLKDKKLYYYKEPTVETKPTNFFLLTDCKVHPYEKNGPLCLELIISGGERRYMKASTVEERDEWIAAIRRCGDPLSMSPKGPAGLNFPIASRDELRTISVDSFDFKKVIGKGNYGKVMLATKKDDPMAKPYAIKVIKKSGVLEQASLQHILAEHKVLQNMDNPFLVKMHYAFQTDDRLYFVMEYVRGGELFYIMGKQGRFVEERACLYTAEICSALTYLHTRGIVYRDLKLENLLLDETGHIKVTDFGLCKQGLVKPGATTSTFCGTPEYLAPEIIEEENYGLSVDWWTLGIVLHEMLVGQPPFGGNVGMDELFQKILHQPISFPGFLSKNAVALLGGLLERNPEKRLGSGPRDGEEIKEHPFYAKIDWNKLLAKEITPLYIPNLSSEVDVRNFDPEFTRMPAVLTPSDTGGENLNIQGFTYIGENKLAY